MKTIKNNIFLTGQAGTGKSTTIKNYIKWANKQGLTVALTASTGVAAVNIGGITIHSFLGSRLSNSIEEYDNLGISPASWAKVKNAINEIDCLVVDEVSMLNNKYIDMIDYIMKNAANEDLPFGGKKIIFTGDFLQLPPISKGTRKFAFEAKAWKNAEFHALNLTKIHRQKDEDFIKYLSKVRLGEDGLEIAKYFEDINFDIVEDDNSVKLFSRNVNVDQYNSDKLDIIDGVSKSYESTQQGLAKEKEQLAKKVLANEILELKINARVMSLKNDIDFDYVNGSTGIVLELNDNSVKVKFDNGITSIIKYDKWESVDVHGKVLATFEQIPLKLAYAITIHKSQGMTIDKLTLDCEGIFEEGQFYVGISRASSKEGLRLIGFEPQMIKANPKAVAFYKNFDKEKK